MDFSPSAEGRRLRALADVFFHRYLLPHNPAWHQSVAQGVYPPPFLEDLKALAQDEGLWNLFLPRLLPHEPGTRLRNLDYAPIAELLGRLPWASEVFNCSAPDTGNIELLHRFASPAQRSQWLEPLLSGSIRSAFAMSEPDVASSDPTNLQTEVATDGDDLLLNGRKWFITGAAHPQCKLLIVMCRHASGDTQIATEATTAHAQHHRHSMVLVPINTPGVEVVRNIPVLNHVAPEGHCEIRLRQVRLPRANVLGAWGEGFAMAQAAWARAGCTTACAPSASANSRCNWPASGCWNARPLAGACLTLPTCKTGLPTRVSRSRRRASWCCSWPGAWTVSRMRSTKSNLTPPL